MNDELCLKCLRLEREHIRGVCPRLGTHVVIDADNLDRMNRTGHPRLLKAVLDGTAQGLLQGVTINALTLDGR